MTGSARPGDGTARSGGPASHATLVTAAAADALAWRPLVPYEDVDYKLLWQSGRSVAGLMRIPPGAAVAPHAHVRSHHHMWVIDGTVEMLGEVIGPGAYAHIPSQVDHGIRAVGDGPATMLYLYLQDEADPET
jgi:mannose-6-phosphate isomerase-like protein (cupin superfamily)